MNGWIINVMADKMYGFIKGEDGRQYFFHASEITSPFIANNVDFAYYVKQGVQVEFDKAESDRGPRATNVILLGEDNAAETN